jgi:hypothetical protein
VVEATELGDVLATASLPHTQGVEIPTEDSLATDDGISQSVVFPFFMELLARELIHQISLVSPAFFARALWQIALPPLGGVAAICHRPLEVWHPKKK